jgi:hypothetical protein
MSAARVVPERQEAAVARSCGGCTACCQVVPVFELGLAQYQGCPHVRSAIPRDQLRHYADRPRRVRCGVVAGS